MAEAPRILLEHHLKRLKLPTFLREYEKVAQQCAAEGLDHVQFLARLVELELIDRERRLVERRIRQAGFPVVKQLESFDFKAIPALNKMLVLDLARGDYIDAPRERDPVGPDQASARLISLSPSASPPARRASACASPPPPSGPRADRGARREKAAPPPGPARQGQSPDRRRARLRAPVADRKRAAVRRLQPALRERRHNRDLKPALPGMDDGVRQRAPHRRAARPHHPPRPYPGDERRQLPAQAEPVTTPATVRITPACPRGPTGPSRGPTPAAHRAASPRARVPPGDKLPPSPQYIFTPPRRYIFTPPLTLPRSRRVSPTV